jgi:hypothetical protein
MQSVHGLVRNRRLQFAVLGIIILFILTIHLTTREPAIVNKQASQLIKDNPTPTLPNVPNDHPLYSDKPEDTMQNGASNDGNKQDHIPTTNDNSDVVDPTKPRHYSMLLIIYSDYRDSDRRHLLRQRFLGLPDSVEPCMHANGDIMYKFAVQVPQQRPTQPERLAAFRDYQSESIEYGDVLELKADDKWDAQIELFRWVCRIDSNLHIN